jgi:hypothetical protein
MEYVIASIMETQDALQDGVERGHWTIEKKQPRALAGGAVSASLEATDALLEAKSERG